MPIAQQYILGELPKHYATITIHTRARSVMEAGDKALDAVDLLRGVWNLFYSKYQPILSSSHTRPKSLNPIILGPLHTLHNPRGDLATDIFWYEPGYLGEFHLKLIDRDWTRLKTFEATFRKRLRHHRYRTDLEAAIIRYTRALDKNDLHSAFVTLWGVVEFLTDTLKKSNEAAVKRLAFLYADYEFYFQLVRHLANFRNRVVHAGVETERIVSLLFQLKHRVEDLILFHVANRYRFDSIADAARLLDHSPRIEVLHDDRRVLEQAIRFRGKRP